MKQEIVNSLPEILVIKIKRQTETADFSGIVNLTKYLSSQLKQQKKGAIYALRGTI